MDAAEKKSPIDQLEVVEIDGLGDKNKPIIGALGGVMGQIIIVLSIMEKNYNRQLTSKSKKSGRSARSKRTEKSGDRKGAESGKEADGKSEKSAAAKSEAEE